MAIRPAESVPQTIPFEQFWRWLRAHHNCVVRAGTPDCLLFDHDDYHWHLFSEDDGAHIVQLVRGKDLVGEIVVLAADIAYVQTEAGDQDEHTFECVIEAPESREVAYYFVMAHGLDELEVSSGRRWTH